MSRGDLILGALAETVGAGAIIAGITPDHPVVALWALGLATLTLGLRLHRP